MLKQAERPPIADDVVEHHQERGALGRALVLDDQRSPEERWGAEVEAGAGESSECALDGGIGQQLELGVGSDDGDRLAIEGEEGGAEDFVTSEEVLEAPVERVAVEREREVELGVEEVEGALGLELVEEPERCWLSERGRSRSRSAGRRGVSGVSERRRWSMISARSWSVGCWKR